MEKEKKRYIVKKMKKISTRYERWIFKKDKTQKGFSKKFGRRGEFKSINKEMNKCIKEEK